MSLLADDRPEDSQHLTESTTMEHSGGTKMRQTDGKDQVVRSAMMEPTTLQWSGDRQAGGQTGWLVLGVSRLRSGVFQPLFDDNSKEAELQEVIVHRRFISDSASLFLIYFLQLVVMAMYLSQEQLKLVPLLTIVFALGRLVYWVAAAFGSSIRGFGFGLSFLPSLTMMAANMYFIFTVEAAGSIFSVLPPPEEVLAPPAGRQRFWG